MQLDRALRLTSKKWSQKNSVKMQLGRVLRQTIKQKTDTPNLVKRTNWRKISFLPMLTFANTSL